MSYSERLTKTNLLPLEFRREISDLLLFFKSKHGLITTDANDYLYTFDPKYKYNSDPNSYNLILKHKQDYFWK